MAHAARILMLLLAFVLAAPSASATWMAYGTSEPNTIYDDVGYLYASPPPAGSDRVYFNGFDIQFLVASPNLGTTGSRMEVVGNLYHEAMLGVWSDCNQDGYVGVAEFALEEYPSQLLSADQGNTLCPDGGANNAGGWVTELRWIGYDYGDASGKLNSQYDPRTIIDPSVKVWGDYGLPADLAQAAGSGTCPIEPFPRGTFHSVGGILNDADCNTGYRGAALWNAAMVGGNVATVLGNPVDSPGIGDPAHLALANGADWTSNPTVDQATFGDDGASHSALKWSCTSTPAWAPAAGPLNTANDAAGDPVTFGEDRDKGNVDFARDGPRAETPTVNPSGNVPGTLNATLEAQQGDCNTSDDNGQDFYGLLLEGDNEIQVARLKTEPDLDGYNFTAGHRGEPYTPGFGQNLLGAGAIVPQAVVDAIVGSGAYPAAAPGCLGVYLFEEVGQNCYQTIWRDNHVSVGGRQSVPARFSIVTGALTFAGPRYESFYATVSAADGSLPGEHGIYGSIQCPVRGSGAASVNGWNCDPAQWYTDAVGNVQTFTNPVPALGEVYELRDVDCYDGQIVAGAPVFAGTGQLGPNDCDHLPPAA